jgi:hypothetical protein
MYSSFEPEANRNSKGEIQYTPFNLLVWQFEDELGSEHLWGRKKWIIG